MILRLVEVPLKLYIGDLPWEKKRRQKVLVNLEIKVSGQPPDYWKISKAIVRQFSGSKYAWVEHLADAMGDYLKTEFKIKGRLVIGKFPSLPGSPRIFQVERPL